MCYCYKTTDMEQKLSKKTRTESDLIGSREVPESALYGVQTLRGIENFRISKFHLNEYPLFIQALAITKMGAAVANRELDLLTEEQTDAILKACLLYTSLLNLLLLMSFFRKACKGTLYYSASQMFVLYFS